MHAFSLLAAVERAEQARRQQLVLAAAAAPVVSLKRRQFWKVARLKLPLVKVVLLQLLLMSRPPVKMVLRRHSVKWLFRAVAVAAVSRTAILARAVAADLRATLPHW